MNKKIIAVAKVNGREVKYRRHMKFTQPLHVFTLLTEEANATSRYYESYIQWKLSIPVESLMPHDPDHFQEIRNPKQYLKIAEAFATMSHINQKRRGGDDFITHPLAVAALMEDDDRKTAAVLHDVIEDTAATYEDLIGIGIPFSIVVHIRHMTREDGISYDEYIKRISQCKFCIPIKIQDINHNLSTITPEMEKEKPSRRKKYADALELLNSSINTL